MMVTPTPPFSQIKLKVNTYIIEASSRNGHIDSFYTWLFLRAVDVVRNGSATGRVHGFKSAVKQLALKMRRTEDRTRRRIREAERNGYCTIDAERDIIWITSRNKLTIDMVRHDKSGADQRGNKLPDQHLLNPENIMEVSVVLSDLWHADNKSLSHSRSLDPIRQRVTQSGWCRETFSKLVGMDRRSTARMDKTNQVNRGFQFALVLINDLVGHQSNDILHQYGESIIDRYHKLSHSMPGRGGKLWLGHYQNTPAIYTQIGIKYDTKFQGKLKNDIDIIRALNSSGHHFDVGCIALQQSITDTGREPMLRGEGVISESQRSTIVKTLTTILSDLQIPHHRTPMVHVVDGAVFGLHSFTASESPNTV
jgi:hypothetical protein